MKKYIMLGIKILPLLTILQGLLSGGARMGPFVDTLKVALTQYEVVQITTALAATAANGPLVSADKFSEFIEDNFYSQYSVLAREIVGDKSHDHTKDIWGRPFQLLPVEGASDVLIASAGPDGKFNNKDDVAVVLPVAPAYRPSKVAVIKPAVNHGDESIEKHDELEQEELREPAAEYDEEGYDRDGFDEQGYNRDGYDVNGNPRSIENP